MGRLVGPHILQRTCHHFLHTQTICQIEPAIVFTFKSLMWRYSSMMAFDFFSIASSVKAGSLGREGAAGALSLAVRGKSEETRQVILHVSTTGVGGKKIQSRIQFT